MPVHLINNSFNGLSPLSSFWTHQTIASEAMVLTNTIDNENIQLDNIRHHINSNISYLTSLLNLATSPWYGIFFQCTLESTLHPSGLEFIALASGNLLSLDIASRLHSIKRLNVVPERNAPNDAFVGNCIKQDISQLTELMSQKNTQWRQSIAWSHHGNEILVFTGSGVVTSLFPARNTNRALTLEDTHFVAWGFRNPILDNLVPEGIPNFGSYNDPAKGLLIQNYYSYVDLPDQYAMLLIKMTQKNILEQLREQVPQALEAEINQGLAQITQNIVTDLQFEASEREKKRYGAQQRPPGAM